MQAYDVLCRKIDALLAGEESIRVAIDGHAAAGKTSLAAYLNARYDCNVFHMDHFFLRPEQRKPERLAQLGGNVDYERFKAEVQEPLLAGVPFAYRPFNCRTGDFEAEVDIKPKQLAVVEGAYSLHPTLADVYHIKVFLTISPREQLRRIEARDGEKLLGRFESEWIPMEHRYFETCNIPQGCDFIFGEELAE